MGHAVRQSAQVQKSAKRLTGCKHNPQASNMLTCPPLDPTFSIVFTTSIPSVTFPNTTCFPSSHEVTEVVRKYCEPLVLGCYTQKENQAFVRRAYPLPSTIEFLTIPTPHYARTRGSGALSSPPRWPWKAALESSA